jgi:iron complex outermembrane receptor protein
MGFKGRFWGRFWGRFFTGSLMFAGFLGVPAAQAQEPEKPQVLPQLNVTASRIGTGITGTSTTIITAEEIERSPAQTLPDILSREPGIQVTNLFGGVNAARSVVDMRGFGATAASNTLVLINGRRVTDLDIVGVDLAAIPRQSIERIEITRGNSGVVLYGDGAVGGVINIVTKNGVGAPLYRRIEGAFGSFNQREGNVSFSGSNGPWSTALFGNHIESDGYRDNNAYIQRNASADIRYTLDQASLYFNVATDDQRLGLPGARRVDPVAGLNQLVTSRQAARTPYDWAERDGYNVTTGFTWMFVPGAELVVDGGVRHKRELAQFYQSTATTPSRAPSSGVDTSLTTASFTPRLNLNSNFGGLPWKATGGFDYYRAEYGSDRPLALSSPPIHRFDLAQTSMAGYWQHTLSVLPSTDISGGVRVQQTSIKASDVFDPNAPGANPVACFPPFGCFGDLAGTPLDKTETNQGYHAGFEHRFNDNVAVFGRWAKSFRVPNVDERVGMVTSQNAVPTTFDLRTQKSRDLEGGVRLHFGPVDVQWSYYDMELVDEIQFRFGPNFEANNINLDPTHRYGHETIASWRVNDQFRIKGGAAYTRAVFREGIFAGNDVPLVSRWTGNIGFSWDIVPKWLTFDTVVRYVGDRRMDNDQTNLQPLIPAHATVDIRLGGEFDKFFWSAAIQNLFDADYFDYAIASPYPYGAGSQLNTYNAYPQPGRTYLVRAGLQW